MMRKISALSTILGLFIFSLCIAGINLFFPDTPGFFSNIILARIFFNPYLALALVASIYYGKYYGFISLLISLFFLALPFPLLREVFYPRTLNLNYWYELLQVATIPCAITLAGTFFFGIIKDSLSSELTHKKEQLKKISRDKGILSKELHAFNSVNVELEKRVSSQHDSLIALHSKIQELYSLNLHKALEVMIKTVQDFTGATSCSVWEYKPEQKCLELRLNKGWSADEKVRTKIPVENSVEGWVLRNNILFSVKMIIQYDVLSKIDTGRNIYTVPIMVGHKVWGTLNIEDIPFEKYNLYTENVLLMITELASPALERALDFETARIKEEVNPVTGFPAFSQFYNFLEKALSMIKVEQGTLSIIIVELANFDDLANEFGNQVTLSLLALIAERIKEIAQHKPMFFHYKSENQICFFQPNLDYDGCSLFCLDILEMINRKAWRFRDKDMSPELILGYTSLSEKNAELDNLLRAAENLLEMQKI